MHDSDLDNIRRLTSTNLTGFVFRRLRQSPILETVKIDGEMRLRVRPEFWEDGDTEIQVRAQ